MNAMSSTLALPDLESRVERLLSFLAVDPDNLALRLDAVATAAHAQRWDHVGPLVDEGLKRHPRSGALHAHAAEFARWRGDLQETLAHLNEAIANGCNEPIFRHNKAVVQFCLGYHRAALETLEHLATTEEPDVDRTLLQARCWQHLGESERATALLEQLCAGGRDNAESRGLLALLWHESGRHDDAFDMAERALAEHATQLEALLARAGVAVERRQEADARADYRLAVNAHPREGRAWFDLSRLNLRAQRYGEAAETLQKTVELWPRYVIAWQALAWSRFLNKNAEEARAALEQAHALEPDNTETLASQALLAALQGDTAFAEERIARAQRMGANSTALGFARAMVSDLRSRPESGGNAYPALQAALRAVLESNLTSLAVVPASGRSEP